MKTTSRNIAAILVALAGTLPASAKDQPDITMAINQSPWLDSFVAMVDLYEAETGNVVNLDVNPFGGLLEKIRNSVRSAEGTYDLVNVNSLWLSEIYSGGFLAPLGDIRDGYALRDGILTYGATTNWDSAVGSFSPDGALMGVPATCRFSITIRRSMTTSACRFPPPGRNFIPTPRRSPRPPTCMALSRARPGIPSSTTSRPTSSATMPPSSG